MPLKSDGWQSPKNILQASSANYSWHLSPSVHPGTRSTNMKQFSCLSYIPRVSHIQREILSIRQWGFSKVQMLFVHSVAIHVCQKELLRCSIIPLTGRDKKTEPVAFYVVFLKFRHLVVWLLRVFREMYFGGFSGLCWGDSHFTVRL